jgi:uncharacterized protein YbaR (Trm112 family)
MSDNNIPGFDKELLDILACPVCKTDVKLTEDKKGLKCVNCGRIYPIRDGIPIMLIDEATIIDNQNKG